MCGRTWLLWLALATANVATTPFVTNLTDDDKGALLFSESAPPPVEMSTLPDTTETTTHFLPTKSTPKITIETIKTSNTSNITESSSIKPKARLLDVNVDDLNPFNVLHNQSDETSRINKKVLHDLSDINLDGEDEDDFDKKKGQIHTQDRAAQDKYYSDIDFHHLNTADRTSGEIEMCNQNGVSYRVGERVDRGCEETCECSPSGTFECSPRCKHPYIRRGRRLSDPLCFESPVDDCCSIIACATGNNADIKGVLTSNHSLDVCHYENDTYRVGAKWNIGCEKICTCEKHAVITCKARCTPLPLSDKCINVQDPNDACCEVQVCDVSQDVHEEPFENVTTTISTEMIEMETTTYTTGPQKTTMRPLVLAEPIGSIKVLQNNTVQVNLIHVNTSEDPVHLLLSSDGGKKFEDVELKHSDLILNLEGGKDYVVKTRETGTKFNFTITALDEEQLNKEHNNDTYRIGCYEGGKFYEVGEEFHIGCTELCECAGDGIRECAALECPSQVGLELVSRGCVRWAPTPPPQPPNCCPRTARCLSDGTCHYKGHPVPNWSEVPIAITGCEKRCFCENGELDCQEICSVLPPLPPQNLRCPPGHRPAPVNMSDDDCCKQWGCVINAGNRNATLVWVGESMQTSVPQKFNNVPPITPTERTIIASIQNAPSDDILNILRHFNLTNMIIKLYPKLVNMTDTYLKRTNKNIDVTQLNSESLKHIYNLLNKCKNEKRTSVQSTSENPNNFKLEKVKPTLIQHPENLFDVPLIINNGNATTDEYNNILKNKKVYKMSIKENNNVHSVGNTNPMQIIPNNSQEPVITRRPLFYPENNYFLPNYHKSSISKLTKNNVVNPKVPLNALPTYFKPSLNATRIVFLRPLVSSDVLLSKYVSLTLNSSLGKHVTVMHLKKTSPLTEIDTDHTALWSKSRSVENKPDILKINSEPYITELLRVPSDTIIKFKKKTHRELNKNLKNHGVTDNRYANLDISQILSQLDYETQVNKNMERSAERTRRVDPKAGESPLAIPQPTEKVTQPSFLPTIPPININFDQNDIHKPPQPPGFPVLSSPSPNFGENNKKLTVISLQADSPTSVKMLFGLPPVLVGLRGSVDLRYIDKPINDVSKWYSQVFAPADEILSTSRLEFRLTGLTPSTTYRVKGKLFLHNLPVEPESDVFTVRTQDALTIEEKSREINSKLTVVEVNDTTAHVTWRHFTEDELQFIDGIQVRFRPIGTPIYVMTELLHHSRSNAELNELRPGTHYEASLVLIPPPRATTELVDPAHVEFTTSPFMDPYNWSVVLESRTVGSEAVGLTWRGIPEPAERWVRVYRAAHACGAGRTKEHDAFRLASRDQLPSITLNGLEPDTKCRVWLELFLTNGKVKTSNVLEVTTKSQDTPEPIDNVIEASSVAGSRGSASVRGDYYGALVVVGVVAALGALTSLLLLLVVVRRHRPHTVPITPAVPTAPRESSLPPYDNPAYKLELQQETMDL